MKKWKQRLAALLTAAMFVTMLPAPVSAAAGMDKEVAGEQGEPAAAGTQMELLASFDFNREAENGKFSGNGAEASVVGVVTLQERDAVNGKALYLDGSKSYLDIKKPCF
ncbi:MAG: hypothetical protein HFH37_10920 [Lachnospiraceae bacterium]|jgi:hypothetical protein|nr:hypothetical protein [Lachnospiraceae bacterium]